MSSDSKPQYDPEQADVYLICATCGTQFPTTDRTALRTCFICDDPRQFTPRTGQSFATLGEFRSKHKNTFHALPGPGAGQDQDLDLEQADFISIVTEPKLAIGQRAVLVRTPAGNVLWDCVTLLDDETVRRVRELGGLRAIVISHPHYYSTHAEWAHTFDCPVYLAGEDRRWTTVSSPRQVFLAEGEFEFELSLSAGSGPTLSSTSSSSGITVLKLGGHFPGSLVLLYKSRLLVADTLMTTPAGLGNWNVDGLGRVREGGRPPGLNSYSFMWSIPNMIPLASDEIERMWSVLKKHEFASTHGAFLSTDIIGKDSKEMSRRVLESMQIQIRCMGYGEHSLLKESWQ
jgi:glyoxylase-like metal-dependent hydrolase (beta-lactamase superfamily II)